MSFIIIIEWVRVFDCFLWLSRSFPFLLPSLFAAAWRLSPDFDQLSSNPRWSFRFPRVQTDVSICLHGDRPCFLLGGLLCPLSLHLCQCFLLLSHSSYRCLFYSGCLTRHGSLAEEAHREALNFPLFTQNLPSGSSTSADGRLKSQERPLTEMQIRPQFLRQMTFRELAGSQCLGCLSGICPHAAEELPCRQFLFRTGVISPQTSVIGGSITQMCADASDGGVKGERGRRWFNTMQFSHCVVSLKKSGDRPIPHPNRTKAVTSIRILGYFSNCSRKYKYSWRWFAIFLNIVE